MNSTDFDFFYEQKVRKEINNLTVFKYVLGGIYVLVVIAIGNYYYNEYERGEFLKDDIHIKIFVFCIFLIYGVYVGMWFLLSFYYKTTIIRTAINLFYGTLNYEAKGEIDKSKLIECGILGVIDGDVNVLRYKGKEVNYRGEDYFSSNENEHNIEFCEAKFATREGKKSVIYRASIANIVFKRNFPGTLILSSGFGGLCISRSFEQFEVAIANDSDAITYSAFTNNVKAAEQFLTDDVKIVISGLQKAISEYLTSCVSGMRKSNCHFALSIHNNNMFIFLPEELNLFEASIFKSQKAHTMRDLMYISTIMSLTKNIAKIDDAVGNVKDCPFKQKQVEHKLSAAQLEGISRGIASPIRRNLAYFTTTNEKPQEEPELMKYLPYIVFLILALAGFLPLLIRLLD